MLAPIAVHDGPTTWDRDSLMSEQWLLQLTQSEGEVLTRQSEALLRSGTTLESAQPESFRRTPVAALGQRILQHLFEGPGFVVARGWNIDPVPEEVLALAYWGLAATLGDPQPQDLSGGKLHVVSQRPVASSGTTAPGGSTAAAEMRLHTENARPPAPPSVLGLLCVRQAPRGGESVLASGHTLHNRLLAHDPALLAALYEPLVFGRHDEQYPDGRRTDLSPVFTWVGPRLHVRYGRYWLEVAEKITGHPVEGQTRAALDAADNLLAGSELPVRIRLQPGDLLFANNRVVLHGRTAFSDDVHPEGRRRLLRSWVA